MNKKGNAFENNFKERIRYLKNKQKKQTFLPLRMNGILSILVDGENVLR